MHVFAVFILFILTALKPLKSSDLLVYFIDGSKFDSKISNCSCLVLTGEHDNNCITLDYYFIEEELKSNYPAIDLQKTRLERGIARDKKGLTKTATNTPITFSLLYDGDNEKGLKSYVEKLAKLLPNRFTGGKEFTAEEFRLGIIIFDLIPNALDIFQQYFFSEIYQQVLNILPFASTIIFEWYFPKEISQQYFAPLRAEAIYTAFMKPLHRLGADFTDTEFNKAIKLLNNSLEKTETFYLKTLQGEFSVKRAQALLRAFISHEKLATKVTERFREGADFTEQERRFGLLLSQKVINKTPKEYLERLQQYFSPARAEAIGKDIIPEVEEKKKIN